MARRIDPGRNRYLKRESSAGMNAKHRNGPQNCSAASTRRLLSDWGRLIGKDPLVRQAVHASGISAKAYIRLTDSDVLIAVSAGRGRLTVKCVRSASDLPCLDLDFFVLHRILSGVQNLMIGLNKRSLDQIVSRGFPGDLLVLLLDMQPILSRIYRGLLLVERDV